MSRVPRIRFKGFEEDWEQRKLGEIADKVVEKNFQLQERDVFTNSAEFGIIDQKDFFDHEIVNKNNIGGYYIVSPNDFVYNPRISVTAPVGPINRNKLCKRGIMSPLYTVFHPRNMNETFLEFYFRTNKWHKFMEYNGDSGARSDRFSIKTELFYAMTIPFPSHKEQSKVGICFESLDHLITLHQRKLEKLKIIKKSMLENLFPQNGEKTPKIRFSGFTEDWEQRKLGEIGMIITGSTPSTSLKYYYTDDSDEGIVWVTPTDIINNITLESEKRLTSLGQKIAHIVPKNTILVTCIASIGKNTMLIDRGSFNQQINGLIPYENKYEPYFLLTESFIWSNKMKSSAPAGTMQIVNRKEFSEIDACIPNKSEQNSVGSFFRTLDHLITLHQSKLEKLQKIKKSMLESMFV